MDWYTREGDPRLGLSGLGISVANVEDLLTQHRQLEVQAAV